jgi:hypothetical protein
VEQLSVAVKVCCVGKVALQAILAIAVGDAVNTGAWVSASTLKLTDVEVLLPQASVATQRYVTV